jgi:hypothetical protein
MPIRPKTFEEYFKMRSKKRHPGHRFLVRSVYEHSDPGLIELKIIEFTNIHVKIGRPLDVGLKVNWETIEQFCKTYTLVEILSW